MSKHKYEYIVRGVRFEEDQTIAVVDIAKVTSDDWAREIAKCLNEGQYSSLYHFGVIKG